MPFLGFSQHDVLADSANTKLAKVAREIITATGICTLITLDEDGNARARAMDAFAPRQEFYNMVWHKPKEPKYPPHCYRLIHLVLFA